MTEQTTITNPMLTKNIDKLRQEVSAHVAADSIIQGSYQTCFIGCLAGGNYPAKNEIVFGLPAMVQRIAETIFESLPAEEAKAFFAALPDAVGCNGKDLSRVGWQFLAVELRSLPRQSVEIQAVIDPVIAGMDLLAGGQEWPEAAAVAAADAAADAAAEAAAEAVRWAVRWAAGWAAKWAAVAAAEAAAGWAVRAARAAGWAAAGAAAGWAVRAAARLRQRDLLLRLIHEAPVLESQP